MYVKKTCNFSEKRADNLYIFLNFARQSGLLRFVGMKIIINK